MATTNSADCRQAGGCFSSAADACCRVQTELAVAEMREPDARGIDGCGSFYSLEGKRPVSLELEDCLGRACAFDIFQVPEHVNLSTC